MEAIRWNKTLDVLQKYGRAFEEIYQRIFLEKGKEASGDLLNSMRYEIHSSQYSIEVDIRWLEYWQYIEQGRKPGKWPPISAIERWIRVKPVLPQADAYGRVPTIPQLAFLISRAIAENGIEPVPIKAETMKELNEQYLPLIGEAIKEDIENDFTKIVEIITL